MVRSTECRGTWLSNSEVRESRDIGESWSTLHIDVTRMGVPRLQSPLNVRSPTGSKQ